MDVFDVVNMIKAMFLIEYNYFSQINLHCESVILCYPPWAKILKICLFEPLNHNKEKQWLDPCLRMIEHWVYVGLKTSWGERGYLIKLRKVTSSWKWWLKKKKKNIESHLTHNWKSKKNKWKEIVSKQKNHQK